MIKASKHPNELQARGGFAVNIYLFATNKKLLASMKTGSVINLDVPESLSLYASFYKDDKDCSLNNKTKSGIITVHPNTVTKLQIGFAQSLWLTKIIISPVDYINAE
jgi:hypothetical protein